MGIANVNHRGLGLALLFMSLSRFGYWFGLVWFDLSHMTMSTFGFLLFITHS
jgi:hypothetical protein